MLPWSTPPWHGTQESVLRVQQHWVRCLREKREPETSGADSLKTYGLVFSAYESARTGEAFDPMAMTRHLLDGQRGHERDERKDRPERRPLRYARRPMFGAAPLSLFSDAGIAWDGRPDRRTAPAVGLHRLRGAVIGGSRVSERRTAGESGKLRVIARNGVGYDAIDTQALYQRGILLTNTPIPVRNAVATTAVAFILALSLRFPSNRGSLARAAGGTRGLSRCRPAGTHAWHYRPRRDWARARSLHAAIRDDNPGSRSPRRLRRRRPNGRRHSANLEELINRSDFVVVACLLNDADPAFAECRPSAPDEAYRLSHQCRARADHRRTRSDRRCLAKDGSRARRSTFSSTSRPIPQILCS